ncbi:DoxX-like family protein [Oceanobacillus picturae]|uniref:DoxX-like family protein n=1 Tax=Oceanobacillus picturae TaxID=171693 RepID=UPI00073DAD8B|nr:DoxX-like family protein [Oceanobacillus picturae]
MKPKPIYVELPIHTDMESLWEATQRPDHHEKWDLRFSSITYLPKKEGNPQRFSYQTKIGFGLRIKGWGESVGSYQAKDDARTSSLHFGTDQKISLIREGRGYWKYKPESDNTVTFLPQYNYETRFGKLGSLFDILLFRPLIGWATALSFDVVKRWLEKGEQPWAQYTRFFTHWITTILFAFVWIYHGLVPKIINQHPAELSMLQKVAPVDTQTAIILVIIIGVLEVLFGVGWLFYRRKRQLYRLQFIAFPLLTVGAIFAAPEQLTTPFNALTFNVALLVLTWVGWMASRGVPTAKNCKRKQGD